MISLSIDKIQYPNIQDELFGTVVWVNVENIPADAKNLVVSVGGYEGTLNTISSSSVTVPVGVTANGTYTVSCNYEGNYDGYTNYFITPDVHTTVTVQNPYTPSAKATQTTTYSTTSPKTSTMSTGEKIAIISIIAVVGIEVYLYLKKK